MPTIGFSNYELRSDRYNRSNGNNEMLNSDSDRIYRITLYDLGGGRRIRTIWKNYYALVHGIVFVIDSSDIERILEVKDLMEEVLSNPLVAGKPILM